MVRPIAPHVPLSVNKEKCVIDHVKNHDNMLVDFEIHVPTKLIEESSSMEYL